MGSGKKLGLVWWKSAVGPLPLQPAQKIVKNEYDYGGGHLYQIWRNYTIYVYFTLSVTKIMGLGHTYPYLPPKNFRLAYLPPIFGWFGILDLQYWGQVSLT